MIKMCAFVFIALVSLVANADEKSNKAILENFKTRLDALTTPEAFTKFVSDHKDLFPDPTIETQSMNVEKEELSLDGDTYTLAMGYRQVFIKNGNAKTLTDIWGARDDYKKYYNLDDDSHVEGDFTKDHFKARIFKKVPAIEDQDYTLDYTITHAGKFTFVRARLDKDQRGFALRDNLKTLEETKEGLIVREISYLYPLRWWVRAMGPTARKTMKVELNKISVMEKCLVDQTKAFPPTDDVVKDCAAKSVKAE